MPTIREAKIREVSKEVCNLMADLLQQEYKLYQGQWWLWSLGKPARPLTDEEVAEAELEPINSSYAT